MIAFVIQFVFSWLLIWTSIDCMLDMFANRRLCCLLFSHWVVSNSLRPHGLQHAKLPCSSSPPGAGSNSCLLSWWCHTNKTYKIFGKNKFNFTWYEFRVFIHQKPQRHRFPSFQLIVLTENNWPELDLFLCKKGKTIYFPFCTSSKRVERVWTWTVPLLEAVWVHLWLCFKKESCLAPAVMLPVLPAVKALTQWRVAEASWSCRFRPYVLSLHCSPRRSSWPAMSLDPVPPPMTRRPWTDIRLTAVMCPSPRFPVWTGPETRSISTASTAMGWELRVERARASLLARGRWRRRRWTASPRCPRAALSCEAPCALCPLSGGTAGVLGRTQPATQKWTTGGEAAGRLSRLSVCLLSIWCYR